MFLRSSLIVSVLFLVGCASFPDPLKVAEPDTLVSYQDAASKADAVQGKQVRWGGAIAKIENKKDGTLLEMVHYPLANYGRPQVSDESMGRFRLYVKGFLDPMVYQQGRLVTVTGNLQALEKGLVGEHEYVFPSVAVTNHYLWKKLDRVNVSSVHVWPHDYWFNRYPFPYHRRLIIRSNHSVHSAHGNRTQNRANNMQKKVQTVRDVK